MTEKIAEGGDLKTLTIGRGLSDDNRVTLSKTKITNKKEKYNQRQNVR